MSSLAPPPAASTTPPRPKTFTGRYIALIAVILIDVAYATLIFAGIGFGDDDRLLPPQVSQIVVGALAAATVITSTIVICGRFAERVETAVVVLSGLAARLTTELDRVREDSRAAVRDEIDQQLTIPGKGLARDVARIKDRLGMREDDDPTVPLGGRLSGHRTAVYASASVHTVQVDGLMNSLRERVDQRVDEAVGAKVQEFGNQRFFAGYAACAEDMSGGSVVALQPRNGQRSSTS